MGLAGNLIFHNLSANARNIQTGANCLIRQAPPVICPTRTRFLAPHWPRCARPKAKVSPIFMFASARPSRR